MYCSACASPIAPGLSFCNRCGTSLKERSESRQIGAISAIVTAMVLVAMAAMGLLLGGPIALKREGGFGEELIVLFMFLTFFICAFSEIPLPAAGPAHECKTRAYGAAHPSRNPGRVSRPSTPIVS